jgi:DNA-binding XRE family transcriptional regulator
MKAMNVKPIEACYIAFGARLRMIREAWGITQDDLANRVGLERTSVVATETGRQRVLLHTIEQYAKALGTSPKHLMRGIWW